MKPWLSIASLMAGFLVGCGSGAGDSDPDRGGSGVADAGAEAQAAPGVTCAPSRMTSSGVPEGICTHTASFFVVALGRMEILVGDEGVCSDAKPTRPTGFLQLVVNEPDHPDRAGRHAIGATVLAEAYVNAFRASPATSTHAEQCETVDQLVSGEIELGADAVHVRGTWKSGGAMDLVVPRKSECATIAHQLDEGACGYKVFF